MIALGLLGPVALLAGLSAGDLIEVAETGLCPGGPPDGSPYPCSAFDYFWHRVLFNGWALLLTGPLYLLGGSVALAGLVKLLRAGRGGAQGGG